MQETLKQLISASTAAAQKSVIIFIESSLYILKGAWHWDMQSEAIYCSDVMSFPKTFEGTKGIIHPDDLQNLSSALHLMQDGDRLNLNFRLITTYGLVKAIKGVNIAIENTLPRAVVENDEAQRWEKETELLSIRKETEQLEIRREMADLTEKLHHMGAWFLNKSTGSAWYSDNVFRIYGLPPQSLNTHAHTFNAFIHPDDRINVLDAFEDAYAKEAPLHLEYRIVLLSGLVRFVRQITHWTYNKKGHHIFAGILQDISEEKEMETSLAASTASVKLHQEVLNLIEVASNTAYWYVNLLTRKATFSANYYRLCGYRQPPQTGKHVLLNLLHPEDKERVMDDMDKLYREHRLPEISFRIIRPDGKIRYLQQSGKVVVINNEMLLQAVITDITDNKTKEQKVEELQQKLLLQNNIYHLAETAASTAYIIWEADGVIQCSEGFYNLLGYKPTVAEAIQRILYKSIHHEDIKGFKDAVAHVADGQHANSISFRIVTKHGIRHLAMHLKIISHNNQEATLGVVKDITDIKALTDQLNWTNQLLNLTGTKVTDMVLVTDLNHSIIYWSQRATAITGIDEEEALHKNLFDVFPVLQDEHYLSGLHAAIDGTEYHNIDTKGIYLSKPHHYTLTPLRNEAAQVTGVLHIIKDITKEHQLKTQLSQRLNFIESLIEASVDRIVVLDHNMNYLYWNGKAEAYYGISRQNVIGKNILEVFPSFRNEPGYQEFRRVLKGETVYLPATVTEDSQAYFETFLIPVHGENKDINAVLWVVHDLSSEMELQAERAKAIIHLQQEQQLLKEAQAIGRIGNFEWYPVTGTIIWSDELYTIFEFKKETDTPTLELVMQMVHPDDAEAFTQKIEAIRSTPGNYQFAFRIITRSKELRHLNLNLESLADGQGSVNVTKGFIQDITDIIAAYNKLSDKESLLKTSETINQAGSYEYIPDTQMLLFSDGMYRLFGEEPGSFEPTLAFIDSRSHPDDVPVIDGILKEAANNKKPYYYRRRIYHKDGTLRTIDAQGRVITDAAGKVIKFLGLAQDVTDRLLSASALQEVQSLTEKVLNAMPDFVMVFSFITNEVEFVSQSQYGSNTQRYQDTIGLPYHDIIERAYPDDREGLQQYIQSFRTAADNELKTFEFRQMIDGNLYWFCDRGKVFKRNENGEVTHFITIVQNITDDMHLRQQLLERSLFVETLINASIDRLLVFDKDLQIITWNQQCETQFGIAANEAMGKSLLEVLPRLKDDAIVMDAIDKSLKGEKVYIPYKQSNYMKSFTESYYIPIKDGNNAVNAVLYMARDVSQRVQDEKALQRLRRQLKKRGLELKEKAEEINRFAFVASHDLKEPLRKIHFFSDLLLSREGDHISDEGKEILKKLEGAVLKLDNLIADLLVLTRINADNETEETVDLHALLTEVLELKKEKIKAAGAVIKAAPLPTIKGNKSHISHLFKNLLSNAIKFQPEGNQPVITISAAYVDGDRIAHPKSDKEKKYLQLTFNDNGIGFDKKFEESIFKIFQKLHAQQHYSGTGIGLAISKKVMDNHNGFIMASSEVGKGAQFSCYFPIA